MKTFFLLFFIICDFLQIFYKKVNLLVFDEIYPYTVFMYSYCGC